MSELLSSIVQPPTYGESDAFRRGYALHVVTLILVGGGFLFYTLLLTDWPSSFPLILLHSVIVSMTLLAYWLNRQKRLQLASVTLLASLCIHITLVTYLSGGTEGVGYLGWPLVIVVAAMILEPRRMWQLLLALTVLAIGLLLLELNGRLPTSLVPNSSFLVWGAYLILTVFMASLLSFMRLRMEGAMDDARQKAAALAARHKELISKSAALTERSDALSRALEALSETNAGRDMIEAELHEVEQLRRLGELAGGIASEFNSLLVGVLGHVMLAEQLGEPESPVNGHLEKAARAARRASSLTRELLVYSGGGYFDEKHINVNEFVRENWPVLADGLPPAIELSRILPVSVPLIKADPGELLQALQLLVANAVGAAATEIHISTHRCEVRSEGGVWVNTGQRPAPGPYVCLTVADNRPGFDPAGIRRLFDPFASVSKPGEGLGLAALLGIMRGHRGGLQVVNYDEGQTRFAMHLPMASQAPAARTSHVPLDGEEMGRDLVLVVDDEAAVREFVNDALAISGWEVVGAADGMEAISLFREMHGRIRLVLLDLTLPGTKGFEVWTALREIDPDVRVVLTSGYLAERALREFDQAALVGFLQKPYEVGDFLELMDEYLGPRKD